MEGVFVFGPGQAPRRDAAVLPLLCQVRFAQVAAECIERRLFFHRIGARLLCGRHLAGFHLVEDLFPHPEHFRIRQIEGQCLEVQRGLRVAIVAIHTGGFDKGKNRGLEGASRRSPLPEEAEDDQ